MKQIDFLLVNQQKLKGSLERFENYKDNIEINLNYNDRNGILINLQG